MTDTKMIQAAQYTDGWNTFIELFTGLNAASAQHLEQLINTLDTLGKEGELSDYQTGFMCACIFAKNTCRVPKRLTDELTNVVMRGGF